MDLLAKVGIIAIILIIIFSIVYVAFRYVVPSGPLTSQEAQQLVQHDIGLNYPNATIIITNVSQSTTPQNSWNMFVTLVFNATRPCPTLYQEEVNYPAFNFVLSSTNLYTQNCVVYGLSNTSLQYYSYQISSPYVAIARSYNLSYPSIVNYVNAYGYNNTNVYAKRYVSYVIETSNKTVYNVWIVNYTAPKASYSQFVVLNSTGSIIYNYTK